MNSKATFVVTFLCIIIQVKSDSCAQQELNEVFMIDHIPTHIANSISQYAENWSWTGKLAAIFTNKIVDVWNFREEIFNPRRVMEDISIKKEDYMSRKQVCEESLSVEHVKFVNYIWLTPRNNPKAIPEKYVKSIERHMELHKDWKFRIWTNMDANIFMDANTPFSSLGLEVLNLDHLKKKQRSDLIDRISEFDNYKKNGGLYVDIAKYLVLENKGGLIVDFNYVFSRSLSDTEVCMLDFLVDAPSVMPIENYFLFAKPDHPIITTALDFITDSIFHPECFVTEILENCDSETITNYFSMLPIQVAFLKNANHGTIDMITTQENFVKCDFVNQCDDGLTENEPTVMGQQKMNAHTSPISSEEFYIFHRAPRDYQPCLSDKNMLPIGTDTKELLWRNIDFL